MVFLLNRHVPFPFGIEYMKLQTQMERIGSTSTLRRCRCELFPEFLGGRAYLFEYCRLIEDVGG
jgi:hypothetical protein